MRAHSQEDRVPTELEIDGGYQGMLDGTSTRPPRMHSSTPRVAATVEAIILKPGLGEHHRYPLATYSESRRKVRPFTARTAIYALKPSVASKGSSV